MKNFTLFILAFGWVSLLVAQTPEDKLLYDKLEKVNWLYTSDLLINSDVVRLGVKEIYLDKKVQYYFILFKDNNKEYFNILANDFVKGDYLRSLFFTQLKSKYDSIRSAASKDVLDKNINQLKNILVFIKNKDEKISEHNKYQLEKLFDHFSANYQSSVLEDFIKIKEAIKNEEDKSWIEEKIITYKAEVKTRKEIVQNTIQNYADNYLNYVFDMLEKRKNNGPRVGVLFLNDKVKANWNKDNERGEKEDTMYIEEADLKFEYGQLAGITIKGYFNRSGNKVFTFHNRSPISFSTKFDVSNDYHVLKSRRIYCANKEMDGYYIRLHEVLYNDYQLNNYTDNYSPIDTVIKLRPFEPGRVIYQERITDLLHAKVYSDFIGYNENNPNGIIQIEVSKRINLKTNPIGHSGKINTWQLFRHITPLVSITKIEQNEKYFNLSLNLDSIGFIKPIELIRYNNFRAGAQLHVLGFGKPEYHSTFNFETSYHIMLTGVSTSGEDKDTVGSNFLITKTTNQRSALAMNITPLILNWHIHPHSQYHVAFSYKLQLLAEFDSEIEFNTKRNNTALIHQLGLFGGVRLTEGSPSEIFVRVILDMDAKDPNQNFLQGQIGYSFRILSGKPKLKERTFFNQL